MSRPWNALLLAVLLAFSWQSFVTQTHVHPQPYGSSTLVAGGTGNAAQLKSGRASSDLTTECPICQAAADAGAYLLPTSVALYAADALPLRHLASWTRIFAIHRDAHAWHSRAPPIPLQA